MDGQVSKDLFQINVGERAVLAPLEVPGRETSPARIEHDVVGVVETVGDGVEQSRLGQRVVAIPPPRLGGRGVYADLAVFPVESLLPWTHIPIVPMMTNALTLRAHSIRHTTSDPATLATAVEAILRGVATGKYQPCSTRSFPSPKSPKPTATSTPTTAWARPWCCRARWARGGEGLEGQLAEQIPAECVGIDNQACH